MSGQPLKREVRIVSKTYPYPIFVGGKVLTINSEEDEKLLMYARQMAKPQIEAHQRKVSLGTLFPTLEKKK